MKTVLIIDDEPDVRALLNVRLTANGMKILEAPDGPSGIALAKEQRPDLILLDIMMPTMDGVETFHALKKDPQTQKIPVIFLTVLAQNIELTKHNLGVGDSYAILSKPYHPQELIGEIRRALGEESP